MSTRTDLLAALAAIDSEIAAAEERIADLRLERRGADALLKRLGVFISAGPEVPEPNTVVEIPRGREDQSEFRLSEGNAKYVADILARADEQGMSLGTIEYHLTMQGTPLNNDQVRSAVAYLKRKNLAEIVTRGMWRLVGAALGPTDAGSPTETVGLPDQSDLAPDGGEYTDGEGSHHGFRIDFAGRDGNRDDIGAPVVGH